MSLDVWLKLPCAQFPGQEPILVTSEDDEIVFSYNITHNLNQMAVEANLYDCLWRPDEHGMTHASQLIPLLTTGLLLLKAEPARFQAFNPPNGWGSYDALVAFVEEYLSACRKHPHAEIGVSR